MEVVHQAPRCFEHDATRWTLARLRASLPWLRVTSDGSLWQLLARLGIRYKRGRQTVHSPDLAYEAKVALLEAYCERMVAEPTRYPLVYLDEVTFYRQPTRAQAYEAQGPPQPKARLSHRSNTKGRIVAALDAHSGQVHYRQRSTISCNVLRDFWYQLVEAYPQAEELAIVLDNWPVHFHPDVLAPLQPQQLPFDLYLPDTWPITPATPAWCDTLPIQLVQLPTYAPWLNPIEKLWRFLYQEVLHLHRLSDQWHQLKQRVCAFLDRFQHGSQLLLRYTGLLGD